MIVIDLDQLMTMIGLAGLGYLIAVLGGYFLLFLWEIARDFFDRLTMTQARDLNPKLPDRWEGMDERWNSR